MNEARQSEIKAALGPKCFSISEGVGGVHADLRALDMGFAAYLKI
jgi:hypothetical protein